MVEPGPSRIDELLAEARRALDRVRPEELAGELAAGALLVDTRPVEQRERDGELAGAIVIDRNVLEWRLDPSSAHRIPEANDPNRRVIIVCNEGYSSSLAAATLRRLGLSRATDLAGGFQALRAGGAPGTRDHWEHIYATRPPTEVSWYQRSPTMSLRLVESNVTDRAAAVIDVGGGESTLVDHLLGDGYTDVTVLDISQHALDALGQRLSDRAQHVQLVRADVLAWEPDGHYDLWHDRAVFHFLTEPTARARYVDVAARALRPGGIAVVGAFADDGPTHCSGLPVARYSPSELDAALGPAFSPISHAREEHITPAGSVQPFTWATLRRA